MFNFSSGLLAGQHDSQAERTPPSHPIPVTFPSLVPPEPSRSVPQAWKDGQTPGLSAQFLKLRKPSDVNLDTLALLNVSFQPQCDFETLLASVSNTAQAHLPLEAWLDPPERKESTFSQADVQLLSSGRRVPDHRDFYERAKELFFRNEDAFGNLSRKPNDPQVRLRLAHFRKFWEGLDNLAYYWDNSLDEYLPPQPQYILHDSNGATRPNFNSDVDSPNGQPLEASETEKAHEPSSQPHLGSPQNEEPRKKAKIEASGNETVDEPMRSVELDSAAAASPATSISSSRALPARTAPPKVPWAPNMEPPVDLSRGSYKGLRIGNGAEMPDQYRLECVRYFLEPITWAFGVTIVPHRRPPVLIIENIRFPVRMSTAAWRSPQDRIKARQGWAEGPVMGIQCRQDTNFGASGNLEAESVLDAVRELGGMLLLAQERAREGRTERRSGEGRWWSSKHRWGGGPGGEVGDAASSSDNGDVSKEEEKRTKLGSKERRRPSPAELWKTVRPGNPLWDPKIVYEAIGKDRSVEWDDVFMVSSLNHHISVLKLRVHPLYIKYITDGTLPEEPPSDPDWFIPKLHRTRWFNLFEVEDRKEAMRGIWGLMSYLLRAENKADMPMKDA